MLGNASHDEVGNYSESKGMAACQQCPFGDLALSHCIFKSFQFSLLSNAVGQLVEAAMVMPLASPSATSAPRALGHEPWVLFEQTSAPAG